MTATTNLLASRRHEDLSYLPDARWMPVLSLGFRSAVADFVWMGALTYYGEGIVARGPVRHVLSYARAVSALEPTFEPIYRFASAAAAYQPTQPELSDLRAVAAYLAAGSDRLPESGQLAWYAGAFYSYELAPRYPVGSEGRRSAREHGAAFLMRAARRGAGPAWLALSNTTELLRLGENERAIEHLQEMYALTSDGEIRDRIGRQIATLRSQADQQARQHALATARHAWLSNFPYLPPILAELVGDRSLTGDSGPSEAVGDR